MIQLSEHVAERIHNIRLVKVSHTEAVEKLKLSKAIDNYYKYVFMILCRLKMLQKLMVLIMLAYKHWDYFL